MTAATSSAADSDPFSQPSRLTSTLSSSSSSSASSDPQQQQEQQEQQADVAMTDEGLRELRSSRSSSKFIREQLEGLGGGGAGGGGRRKGEGGKGGGGDRGGSDSNRVKVEDENGGANGSNGNGSRGGGGGNGAVTFEEDEDAGALQWGNLQKLDSSDDKTAAAAAVHSSHQHQQQQHAEDANDVAAAASALLSASTLPIERNGMAAAAAAVAAAADRMEDAPSTNIAAASDKQPLSSLSMGAPIVGATFQPASYISIMPRPQPPGTSAAYPYPPAAPMPQSPSTAPLDGKRKHSSLTNSPSSSSTHSAGKPSPPSASLPPSAAGASPSSSSTSSSLSASSSSGSSSRKRRKKEDEENSLNLAYERQISLLNEAIRQLLAYVSPLHSQADAYVDELITGYRSEYMKEQLREGRTAENKRYARAMSGYFLSFYSSSNLNTQLALQHSAYYPPGATGNAASTSTGAASPSSAQSASQSAQSGSSTPVGSLRPDVLLQQRVQADTWEGLSHPLFSNLTLLLYTVIDALLMDALQVTLWSLYLERLEPFFVLDPSPQSQARMLLLTAYAVKLAYCGNHDIYLPYLTGLYAQFSKLFADYIHSKPAIKLGIGNTQLTARYRLLGSLRDKE